MADKAWIAIAVVIIVIIGLFAGNSICDECIFEMPSGSGGGGFSGGTTTSQSSGGGTDWTSMIIGIVVLLIVVSVISKITTQSFDFTRAPRQRLSRGGAPKSKIGVDVTVPENIRKGQNNDFQYVFRNKTRKNLKECKLMVNTSAFIDNSGQSLGKEKIIFLVEDVGKKSSKNGVISIFIHKNVSDGLYNIKVTPHFNPV